MSDYKTGNSNSAYTHDPNVYRESCSDCGQRLESNETFEAYGIATMEFLSDYFVKNKKTVATGLTTSIVKTFGTS